MARTLWSGFLWQLASGWGTRVGTLLVFTLLARLLAPSELGAVTYVQGLIFVLLVVADLAMAEYLVYRQQASAEVAESIWWFQLAFSTVLAALLVLLSLAPPAWLLPSGVDPMLLTATALVLPLLAAGKVPEALMRRHVDGFRTLALRQLWCMLAGAAVALPLAALGAGAWALIAKQWVEALFGLWLFFPRASWRPIGRWRWGLTGQVMRESWGLMGSRIVDVAAQRLDSLLIGHWLGVQALGWYAVAQKLYQVLQGTLSGALYSVVNSRLGALRGDSAASRSFLMHALCAGALVMCSVLIVAWLVSGPLVLALFGAKWSDSVPLLSIMLLVGTLAALLQVGLAPYVSLVRQDNRWVLGIFVADLLTTMALIVAFASSGLAAIVWALALKPIVIGAVWWCRADVHLTLKWREWLAALAPAGMQVGAAGVGGAAAALLWPDQPQLVSWAVAAFVFLATGLQWPLFGAQLRAVRAALHR